MYIIQHFGQEFGEHPISQNIFLDGPDGVGCKIVCDDPFWDEDRQTSWNGGVL